MISSTPGKGRSATGLLVGEISLCNPFQTGDFFLWKRGSYPMIKLTKCVLIAAVAAFALAGTSTLSHAPMNKATKPATAAATCVAPKYTTTACANNFCRMAWCGLDGKWYPSLLACWQPGCPKA